MPSQPPLVLVADDVASLRLLYATLLTGEGYRVVEARDGVEALERIRADHPALMILDISMPRMDGIQVLEALRKSGSRIPALVITAHKERETVLAAAQQGIVSYLTKPINISEFRDRVRKTLIEHGALKAGSASGSGAGAAQTALDAASQEWLSKAPAEGWTLQRLDDFLQAGEDLGDLVASIAIAADGEMPHEPSRAERLAQMPPALALAKLRIAFQRGDPQVRGAVLDLLPAGAKEIDRAGVIREFMGESHPLVRAKVLAAAGSLKEVESVKLLLPLLDDPRPEVVRGMLDLLDGFGWLKLFEPVLESYALSQREVPEAVCERLRGQPSSHILDRMRGVLRGGDSGVRAAAARLASRLGWPEARRMTESALSDPEPLVRAAAVEGLLACGDRRGAGLVFELATDPDPAVLRSLARAAEAASFRPETRRLLQRAAELSVEARAALPGLLARLETSPSDLPALLLQDLRSGEASRAALVRLAGVLGSKEPLPPGPLGPVMAKAWADHLAGLLLKTEGS